MPRIARSAPGGYIYHVLNRTIGRMHMFRKDADFTVFQRIMVEAHRRHPIRLLSYCLMSNHWHFVAAPRHDGDLTNFFRWLAHTHAMRWRVSHHTVGHGHLYQGRFKSFPIQRDENLLAVCRYVERNPLSAGLVRCAQNWPWSSLWARDHGDDQLKSILSPWPVDRPTDWIDHVNQPLTEKEKARMLTSIHRGRPFGTDRWINRTVTTLKLEHTIRPEGRPRKEIPNGRVNKN